MRQKTVLYFLSILLLLAVASQGFAKQIADDDDIKKKSSKVVSNKKSIQKAEINSKEKITKPAPTGNLNKIQTEFPAISTSSMTGEQINWQVISSGGTLGSSTNYILSGTLGQVAAGLGSSTNYIINSGFWQNFSSGGGGCCLAPIRGDFDVSGGIDISDLVALVSFMFSGGDPSSCFEEADVDGSGGIDISDLVGLVSYMFSGGVDPALCP